MLPKIFYKSKTAKTDCNVTNIRELMGVFRYQCTFFTVFNIQIHY